MHASTAPVAVITGAGRGIGQALAFRLHREGYRLALCDTDLDALHRTGHLLPGEHHIQQADVTRFQDLENLKRQTIKAYGRLDVWINNAGVIPSGRMADQSPDELARTWEVNLGGTVYGCRAALPYLLGRGSGHLVNIASVCAVKPLAGLALYSATKAGVVAFSEALRREIRGSGVHISTVLPYMVATDASAGLRPRLLKPLPADAVANAVWSVLRHPRSRVTLPRPLGWALRGAALLPEPVRDLLDGWTRLDHLALSPETTTEDRSRTP